MKKTITFMAAVMMFGFAFANDTLAQRGMTWKGAGGWGPGTAYGRMYNSQTVESLTGEVLTLRDANGFPAWSGWRRR